MSNLYELTDQYKQILAVMEEGDEEYPFEMLVVGEALDKKIEQYCRIIRMLEADAEAYKAEAARLTELQRKREKAVTRMKDAVMKAMTDTDKKKVKTDLFEVTVCKSGGLKPLVFDSSDIPDEYLQVKYEPDKKKIRAAIEEDGEILDFAHLEERGEYLKIK